MTEPTSVHAGSGSTGSAGTLTATVASVSSVSFRAEGREVPEEAGAKDSFVFQPLEDVELEAKLTGFPQAPKSASFELYAQTPVLTGAGKTTPDLTVAATKKTPKEASATWHFDPADAKQKAFAGQNHVWLVARADDSHHLVQVGLRARGFHALKWSTGQVAEVKDKVTLSGEAYGFDKTATPEVKVYDAALLDKSGLVPAGSTALATVPVKLAKGRFEGKWDAALPAKKPAGGGKPEPLPSVVFVVKVGTDEAVSPALGVLPPLRLKLEAGDPNWLMEPICAEKGSTQQQTQAQVQTHEVEHGFPPTAAQAAAGAAGAAAAQALYPKRVLGIKRRLQALGYYYEKLPVAAAAPPPPPPGAGTPAKAPAAGSTPPPAATGTGTPAAPPPPAPDPNAQTRVFRKCVRWYWANVDPGKDAKVPTTSGSLDASEVPPLKGDVIDVYHADFDGWCQRLEDRIRAEVVRQVPTGGAAAAGAAVDLTKDAQVVLPGDFHLHNQELIMQGAGSAPAGGPPREKTVDYTYRRPLDAKDDQDYALQLGGWLNVNPPVILGAGDFRHLEEKLTFARNTALGKVPIVARVEMQLTPGDDTSWAPGPATGARVVFQLEAVDPKAKEPAYLDALKLRSTSGIQSPRGTFPALKTPNPPRGPRGYLAQFHGLLLKATPPKGTAADSDPTPWNAPAGRGGKRSLLTDVVPVAGNVLLVGQTQEELGVPPGRDFPWPAENAAAPAPASTTHHDGAISVETSGGSAACVFSPSRLGGDAYRIKAFVEGPRQGKTAKALGTVVTAPITTWKRVRITRSFKVNWPADWKQAATQTTDVDYTLKDTADPARGTSAPMDEVMGEVPAIRWEKVAALYEKAFILLETPASTTDLVRALRDKAAEGAMKLVESVVKDAAGAIDWTKLTRRRNVPPPAFPAYDPASLIRRDRDWPVVIDWRSATDYDIVAPAGAAKAGAFPYNSYYQLQDSLTEDVLAYFAMFLDPGYDPAKHADYDGVPFPGVTCIQAPWGDSYSLSGHAEQATFVPGDSYGFAMPPGTATPSFGAYALATPNTPAFAVQGSYSDPTATDPGLIQARYTNEEKHAIIAKVKFPAPLATVTLDQILQALKSAPEFASHPDYAGPVVSSASVDSFGRISFELNRTKKGGTDVPRLSVTATDDTKANLDWPTFRIDPSATTTVRLRSRIRLVDGRTLSPIRNDLKHDLGELNWLALQEGDRIAFRRYRLMDQLTSVAKTPLGTSPPSQPKVWKEIEFTYGSPSGAAQGRTLDALDAYVRAHLADLGALRSDITYETLRRGAPASGATPATLDRVFEFRSQTTHSKRPRDGLWFEFVARIRNSKGTDFDETNFLLAEHAIIFKDPANPGRGALESLTSSGQATWGRAFYVFYGQDCYSNAGFWGPDPTGGSGRGYRIPSASLFPYNVDVNTAHELGHALYLRHHWTGSRVGATWSGRDDNFMEHDDDDACLMGYYTSFVDPDTSVPARARGLAEHCGRCLLKLRGWNVGYTPNAPAARPGTTKPPEPPAAKLTGIKDWSALPPPPKPAKKK